MKLVVMIVLIVVFAGCITQNQVQLTTTTTLNESQLMEKYLSDNKFCVKDSDCHLRCGGNMPVVSENIYYFSNKGNAVCNMASPFAKNDNPTCLCNVSINKCYLVITRHNITIVYDEENPSG